MIIVEVLVCFDDLLFWLQISWLRFDLTTGAYDHNYEGGGFGSFEW